MGTQAISIGWATSLGPIKKIRLGEQIAIQAQVRREREPPRPHHGEVRRCDLIHDTIHTGDPPPRRRGRGPLGCRDGLYPR